MKYGVFCAVLSIAVVTFGGLIVLVESVVLCTYGATLEEAVVYSLYSGLLVWVILAAVLISTDKFWKLVDKLIKK